MTVSREDMQFLHLLSEKIQHDKEGHLEMPLTFRVRPQLPDNRQLAMVRLKHLNRKMMKSSKYIDDYFKSMDSLFHDGDAEEVGDAPEKGITWYIPHHGMYRP